MSMMENQALKAFVSQMAVEVVFAQVLIRKLATGYELLHLEDRAAAAGTLRVVKPDDARSLAQFTAAGEFRPLKAAPTLQRGWRIETLTDARLEQALNGLYPGALADWHAAQSPDPPVTDYRACAERQSGMYRITAKLSDAQAAVVISRSCDAANCLKRRLWLVTGLERDPAGAKSLIPCLEPCAVLLEQARKAARAELDGTCAGTEAG
jgi:hypothetical protein